MIRVAVEKDISRIIELGKIVTKNFEKTYNISDYIKNKNYIILVNDDKIINGFLIVYKNIDYYELEIIVVDNKYRKQGIASNLLSCFENKYLKSGDIIYLEVADNNDAAKKLYSKFDFSVVNIRKKYYNNADAEIMKKVMK